MSTTTGKSTSTAPTTASSASAIWQSVLQNPFGVTWRSALVKAPRLVPMQVLKYTCPEGPYPIYYQLKSRDVEGKGRAIPVFIWVPPPRVKTKKRKLQKKGSAEKLGAQQEDVVVEEVTPPTAPYPVVIDFHGGSFVLGSCLEQGPFCAQLCRELGAVVISVDYRMGPVDKFPAAIHDGEDVLKAVMDGESEAGKALRDTILKRLVEDQKKVKQERKEKAEKEKGQKRPQMSRSNTASAVTSVNTTPTASNSSIQATDLLDTTRIAISGFSAGGNLAHNMCNDIKPPDLPQHWPSLFPEAYPNRIPLLLYYPVFDARLLPSQRTKPSNVPAPSSLMSYVDEILAPMYLPRDQAGHPRASPGISDVQKTLHPMAKVFLVLPEIDTLGEQSETWIKAVEEAGRKDDLEVRRYPGMKHGWTQFPTSWLNEEEKKTRKDAIDGAIALVKEAWRK